MSFLFSKRTIPAEEQRQREAANRQEFDGLVEIIRDAYSQAQSQPQTTVAEASGLLTKVKKARTLDRDQRAVLTAYIQDAVGYASLELGRLTPALAALGKAHKLYAVLPDKTLLINNLMNQARGWLLRNSPAQAMLRLETALKVAKEERLSQLEADVLYKTGVLYNLTGKDEAAQEVFGRGLLLAQQTGNRSGSASFLAQFGQLYRHKGDLEKAQDYYERSRAIFEELDDRENWLFSLGQLDQLYRQREDYDTALGYALKGLELARSEANRREETIFLHDLALIYQAQQNYPAAQESAEACLELATQREDKEHQMRAYSLLSQIGLEQKEFAMAQSWAEKGYELAQRVGNKAELAVFLNDLAEIELGQGEVAGALAHFEQLAAHLKANNDRTMLATLYTRMGEAYLEKLHDPQATIRVAEQSFELAVGHEDGEAALFAFTSTMRLIQLLGTQQYYEEGLSLASRCLEQANRELAAKSKDKNSGSVQQGRWLLFVQVLLVLTATLQDLKKGQPDYTDKVKDILGQLTLRFGDGFTLDSWTGDMYERLK